MKKVLLIFVAIVFATGVFSQTSQETMDWLEVNFKTITYKSWAGEKAIFTKKEAFFSNSEYTQNGIYVFYKNITGVKIGSGPKNNFRIYLIGEFSKISEWDRENNTILDPKSITKCTLYIKEDIPLGEVKKIVKAPKHIAKLNGANLVQEDLFD